MVKKILSMLHKEWSNVNEAALLLGFFTLVGQILALVRDRTLASILGPGESLDVYYVAFRIPDFLFLSIASLVSVTVLIPFLVGKLGDGIPKDKAKKFLSDVFTVFLSAMVIVTGVLFIVMPKLAHIVAPGFDQARIVELVKLSRIMLLSPLLLGLSNLIGTIPQIYRKFFVYALAPALYNIGIIIGIVVFYKSLGLTGLAIGVVIGTLLHFLVQLPTVIKQGFLPKLSFSIDWKSIREVVKLSLPRTLTLSLGNITLICIIALASLLQVGSVSLFTFAYNLQSVPLNIIGVSFSVAAFPTLARFFSSGDEKGFLNHLIAASRQIVFWSLPVMFLFIVLRAHIVRVILGSGMFSWDNTRLVAAGLAIFSISIVAQGLSLLFVRGYYAAGRTKRPLLLTIISSSLTVLFAFVCLKVFQTVPEFQHFIEALFRVADVPGTSILMLPLAYTLGAIVNFLLLFLMFRKDFPYIKSTQFTKTFFKSFAGAFFMGYVTYILLSVLEPLFSTTSFMGIFLQGFISGIIGIIAGIVVLKLLKSEELDEIYSALKTKFWNAPVIAPQQEEL